MFISGVNSTVESLSLAILQRDGLLSADVDMLVLPITTTLGITTVSQTSTRDCMLILCWLTCLFVELRDHLNGGPPLLPNALNRFTIILFYVRTYPLTSYRVALIWYRPISYWLISRCSLIQILSSFGHFHLNLVRYNENDQDKITHLDDFKSPN